MPSSPALQRSGSRPTGPVRALSLVSSRATSGSEQGEDLPEARRLNPASLRGVPRRSRLLGGALIGLAATIVVVPLSWRWLAPGPVAGLAARPGPDGRLLGHFPYAEASPGDLVALGDGQHIHAEAAASLAQLLDAARADGIDLVVLSAFRSHEVQRDLFFDVKAERNQSARDRAQVSAPPGYSEHGTGYAVDLGDASRPETNLSTSFEDTEAFAWLRRNGARFHFELSFPEPNPQGVSYEPWHWRFQGSSAALKVFEPASRLQP